jgi:GntR family transcriptional repressor for pyruvate dehydrogenase complex
MRRVQVNSAAHVAADVLREAILAHDGDAPEWFLGSEDEILKRLGVSRPTLRQAARLVEQEGLLTVRRGIGGGLFGRWPSRDAVTHMATISLRSAGTTYGDLIRSLAFLSAEAARLAAANSNPTSRARVIHLVDLAGGWPKGRPASATEAQQRAAAFHELVAELAGSPALKVFIGVLIALSAPIARRIFENPEHAAEVARQHKKVAAAIAAGDAEAAARQMRAHLLKTLHWIDTRLLLQLLENDQLEALPSAG